MAEEDIIITDDYDWTDLFDVEKLEMEREEREREAAAAKAYDWTDLFELEKMEMEREEREREEAAAKEASNTRKREESDDDDYDYWMDPAVAEKMEIDREMRRKEVEEEESSDEEPDFRFRIGYDAELLQIEREQLSKKNLETSVVHFIKHQELGLQTPRTNSLRTFLLTRNSCARRFNKYDDCRCYTHQDPIRHKVDCRGNSLRVRLEFLKDSEKLQEDTREETLRWNLSILQTIRADMKRLSNQNPDSCRRMDNNPSPL